MITYRSILLLTSFFLTRHALAQPQKRAEVSLVEAELMLANNKKFCDSMLAKKDYYLSDDNSIIVKNDLKTCTYKNKKTFVIKITTKGDSLKIISWDEPVSTLHLLFKEAELLDYRSSEINPGILDNKYRKSVLVIVPQVNRIRNTNAIFLAKKK